jgi:hypothetical protein
MKNKYFSMRSLFVTTGIVLSGLIFVGCNKDDDTPIDTPVAGLMAANLAPDKAAIGVSLSGNGISGTPLTYTSFTGGYLSIYPGNRPVEAYDYNSGASFTSENFNFEADKYYSLFVVGANDNYRNVIVEDDFNSLSSTSGSAYIRYINALPDSTASTVTISANGGDVVNENASYAAVSNFVEVTAGSVTIDVSNGSTVDATRTITLEERKVYTVLLIGDPNAPVSNVEIRYIENGTLSDEEPEGRISASTQSATSK